MTDNDSPSGTPSTYRWKLHRTVSADAGRLCWVMLNPSTADATTDDPTIRRVIRFTRDNGFSELSVVNLFALRATDPVVLRYATDPVGKLNRLAVGSEVIRSTAIVCAWGSHPAAMLSPLRLGVVAHAHAAGRPVFCLGTTANGSPRHPLYVAAATQFQPFDIADAHVA